MSQFMLTNEQLNEYKEKGYLVLPELFSEQEMDDLKQAANQIVDDI